MSIELNKLMNLADGKVLYDDLRQRIEQGGTSIIDDTAGEGDTDKAWSADKLTTEFTSTNGAINTKQDAPESAGTAGQVLGLDSNLDPVWMNGVDPSDIENAVDDWLDENITNPDSPPLDRSLTSSSAAAPADIVGDIKNDIDELPKELGGTFVATRLIEVEEDGFFIVDESYNIACEIDDLLEGCNTIIKINEPGLVFVDNELNIGYVLNAEALNYLNIAYAENIKKHTLNGTWCSIGTSITWYNDHPVSHMTKGYQDRVMEVINVDTLYNVGYNGGTIVHLANNLQIIVEADWYTIEHGINDWGHSTPVGTRSDYVNNTGDSTFYGCYRIVMDKIYQLNPNAKIILCTPRKAYGFNNFLPATSEAPLNNIYLYEYVNAVKTIAEIESLPVCDWFGSIGVNDRNLRSYSIDDALHPNDAGMQIMADKLIKTMESLL